jgi:TPR repeat protein
MPIQARRHSPRVKPIENAHINFGAGNRGVVLDVSEGGLRFKSSSPLEPSDPIHFSLTFNSRTEGAAALAWSDESRTTGGLRFTSLPTECRDQIRTWVRGGLHVEPYRAAVLDFEAKAVRPTQPGPSMLLGDGMSSASILGKTRLVDLERPSHADSATIHRDEASVSAVLPPVFPPLTEPALKAQAECFEPMIAPAPVIAEQGSSLSMFRVETSAEARNAAAKSYAYNFGVNPPTSAHRSAGTVMVVLFALSAAGAAAAYYYPREVRQAMGTARAKFAQLINPARKQSGSRVEPAAMSGAFASNPEMGNDAPPDVPTVAGNSAEPRTPATMSGAETQPSRDPNTGAITPKTGDSSTDAALTKNNSQADLELAQTYLTNGTTPDDKARAVQLLWLATEKGSVDAEIQLADLYARGDSVPKSCTQARILLKAAAIANPTEAQPKLAELDSSGCS